jgi:hypothetical protein
MSATSRWVRYPVGGTTYISTALEGERGRLRGTNNVGDTFTIPASANNQLKVNIDTGGLQLITLSSGSNLDPRFVARDIQRKLQAFGSVNNGFKWCTCEFSNYKSGDGESHFVIRSGSTGILSTVAMGTAPSDAKAILGLTANTAEAGTANHTGTSTPNNAAYTGTVTVTGTYGGMLDEEYHVVCSNDILSSLSAGGGNTYAGTASFAGYWNADNDCSYTITIDASGGKEVMNAGTGSVPTFTVNDTGSLNDDVATGQEMLFSDNYYYIGTYGATVAWTDAQFGDGDDFTLTCTAATDAGGGGATAAVGAAKVVWTSSRGDNCTSASTTQTTPVTIGTHGVSVAWSDSGVLTAKDEWRVLCRAPTPEAYNVTSMSYGNVTVTTNSPVKVHQFELSSGAKVLSNVKFSLQSHGSFSHHDEGDGDTEFHFGTVGAGQNGDGAGGAGTGLEWVANVLATDISQDKTGGNTGAPTNLYSSKQDLAVVSDADNAESVGNVEVVSDFIFTSIKLGANETGSNSSINYRLYFDYS